MKYLRDFKGTFTCKSIILMTLLGNQVSEADAVLNPQGYADVPTALVTLIGKLADWLPVTMPTILDPGGTGDNFSERYKDTWNYTNFRTRIQEYAARMKAAYDETDREAAIALWREVFGDAFKPETTTEKALRAVVPAYPASVPYAGEQFIDKPPFDCPVRLNPLYRARIIGRVTGLATKGTTQRRGFRQYELAKQGNMAPKQRSLLFSVSTTVPEPYTVYWKVRNGGAEAAQKQELRGEISRDADAQEKSETTLYTGTHYVECYIVKDGTVVAKDRQSVVVT